MGAFQNIGSPEEWEWWKCDLLEGKKSGKGIKSIVGVLNAHWRLRSTNILGAMAKDSYGQISDYFGILSVEQLITNRHNRFPNRYRCQENYLCQALIM